MKSIKVQPSFNTGVTCNKPSLLNYLRKINTNEHYVSPAHEFFNELNILDIISILSTYLVIGLWLQNAAIAVDANEGEQLYLLALTVVCGLIHLIFVFVRNLADYQITNINKKNLMVIFSSVMVMNYILMSVGIIYVISIPVTMFVIHRLFVPSTYYSATKGKL